jgi:hypothetical protein
VKYKDLYGLIERVIDAAIPLWNLTLEPLEFCHWDSYSRIHYHRACEDLIKQPEPGVFEPPTKPDTTFDLKAKCLESGLQIIVKLANIHLTPENPSYEGGSWQLAGQLVGFTALYFLQSEI